MKPYGLFLLFAVVLTVNYSAGTSDARDISQAFYQPVLENSDEVLVPNPDFEAPVVLTVFAPHETPKLPTAPRLTAGFYKDVVESIRGPTGNRCQWSELKAANYSYRV